MRKSELQNPMAEKGGFKRVTATTLCVRPTDDLSNRASALVFEFRISGFFRVSAFGLRDLRMTRQLLLK